jgi:hypothetical protein
MLFFKDPHFVGVPRDARELSSRGYVKWMQESELVENSFYNLCMPKL